MDGLITAVATVALFFVGLAQAFIFLGQQRQGQLTLIEEFRKRWLQIYKEWGVVIFVGRDEGEYYQILDDKQLNEVVSKRDSSSLGRPSLWALDAVRDVTSLLSDICVNVLEGRLNIRNVYSIFGTELLRHGKPLRVVLDNSYFQYNFDCSEKHMRVRKNVQEWLVYHDGIRRRCLILVDLLWAEAVRLGDLPPFEIKSAADSKLKTGKSIRTRLFKETLKLGGYKNYFHAINLCYFLMHAEYRCCKYSRGVDKELLAKQDKEWESLLLRNFR